jgi:hypothetical protein
MIVIGLLCSLSFAANIYIASRMNKLEKYIDGIYQNAVTQEVRMRRG